jgi:hypothetical protein
VGDIVGLRVFFEKSAPSDVLVKLDATILAKLDPELASQVALAIDRGLRFTGTIEKTFPTYDERTWKPTGSQVDIKWEYQLQKGEPAIKPLRQFFTKVVGVTFEGRQKLVARCFEGETLILEREPDNPKDEGAIKVLRTNGEHLGYIPRNVATGLAVYLDRANKCECKIIEKTGGGDLWLGLNIQITKLQEDYDALVQRRLREIAAEASAGLSGTGLSVRGYAPTSRVGSVPTMTRPALSQGVWIAVLVLAVLLVIASALQK